MSPRVQTVLVSVLICLAVIALFVLFIWFRGDGELIAALSSAGTVAAGVFAALAAAGSMRAAVESSATARRSREATARTAQPRIQPSISRDNGRTFGNVRCVEGHGAVDVTAAWVMHNEGTMVDQRARLEPPRPDQPPGAESTMTVDLELPDTAKVWEEINFVWIEYWDDRRVGHWRDTWQASTEPHRLVQTESKLVD